MIAAVELPLPLRQHLRNAALRAFPRECCGLLEGTINDSVARVAVLHPMANVANEPDAFEIDPARHVALLRELRGRGREIIGCYHSHPNGRAEPSTRDCESAFGNGFLWLIASVEEQTQETGIAAFVSADRGFSPLPIETGTGAAATPGVDRSTTPLI